MSTGWQCGRCGTMYGWLLKTQAQSLDDAVARNLTQKTMLATFQDLRRVLFARCQAGKCPTTFRALLWRLFGRRGHPGSGYRPGLRWGLKSLRHGDPLYVELGQGGATVHAKGDP